MPIVSGGRFPGFALSDPSSCPSLGQCAVQFCTRNSTSKPIITLPSLKYKENKILKFCSWAIQCDLPKESGSNLKTRQIKLGHLICIGSLDPLLETVTLKTSMPHLYFNKTCIYTNSADCSFCGLGKILVNSNTAVNA